MAFIVFFTAPTVVALSVPHVPFPLYYDLFLTGACSEHVQTCNYIVVLVSIVALYAACICDLP